MYNVYHGNVLLIITYALDYVFVVSQEENFDGSYISNLSKE